MYLKFIDPENVAKDKYNSKESIHDFITFHNLKEHLIMKIAHLETILRTEN